MVDVISVPVSDVDRSKCFYLEQLSFSLVWDAVLPEGLRWVQLARQGAAPR